MAYSKRLRQWALINLGVVVGNIVAVFSMSDRRQWRVEGRLLCKGKTKQTKVEL